MAPSITTTDFAGKFSYSLINSKNIITLAGTGNILTTQAGKPDYPTDNQLFNLYGDTDNTFTMQGPNWNYVTFGQGWYVSTETRTSAAVSVFSYESSDTGSACLVENAGGTKYYVVVDSGTGNLTRIPYTSQQPNNGKFDINQVTYSLAYMRKVHSTLGGPLTGVYLAGLDLTGITFTATDVSYANLSDTKLANTNFNGAIANNTIFDLADLTNWIANGLTFTNCSFVNCNMNGVKLVSASLNGCNIIKANFANANLQGTDFTNAVMINCSFNTAMVNAAIFSGTNLTNADFSAAIGVSDVITIEDAILIAANLINKDLTRIKINKNTNFMNARLDHCDLTGHDLTNVVFARASMQYVKLDGTILDGAQMAFADLSFASVTGAVSMVGANLSNTNLESAQFPGAQLGAKKTLYSLPLSDAAILDNAQVPADLKKDLNLSDSATVTVIQPGNNWIVTDGSKQYQVNNTGSSLLVQTTNTISNAAILSDAYMFNTNFAQANMYAVEMSGVSWYGGSANALSADLGLANLSNANLANMNFKQCLMQGASLAYSSLIGTVFDGANLNPSENLKPTSFAFASMQSTTFKGVSNLNNANLTNAAFGLTNGVPLFTIDAAFAATLNKKVVSNDLKTAFSNNSYALIIQASVTSATKDTIWTINNTDASNAAQTGYSAYTLVMIAADNGLSFIQVYGASPLLVLMPDGQGGQTQLQLHFGPTDIDQNQMNSQTTCPSGIKLAYLSPYLTYEELMTAALPPQPPTCLNCWG